MVSRRTRKRIRRGIIIILSTFLLSLVMLEILLRIVAPQYRTFTQPDDIIGWSFIPNRDFQFVAGEGCPGWGTAGVINARGLMDDENYDYERTSDSYRILMLGDSYTEALQFDRDVIFPELLEKQLNDRDDGTLYEVINAGRSGMGTSVQYEYYLHEGQRYDPDLVVVYFIPNDIQDNSWELVPQAQPYHRIVDGELVVDNSFRNDPSYRALRDTMWLQQNFLIYPFVRQNVTRFQQAAARQREAEQQQAEREALTTDTPPASDDDVTSDSDTTYTFTSAEQTAIDVTQAVMLALYEAVKANGSDFLLVIGTAHGNVTYTRLETFDIGVQYLDHVAHEIMRDFAEANDMPYLEMTPILRDYSVENQVLIHGCEANGGYGHYNAQTHAVIADTLQAYIETNYLNDNE